MKAYDGRSYVILADVYTEQVRVSSSFHYHESKGCRYLYAARSDINDLLSINYVAFSSNSVSITIYFSYHFRSKPFCLFFS